MYKYIKSPEVPTSSPDVMTFPFEFGSFQFTMENYVRSYTRKRVTKENLTEVMEEVNTAIKPQADGFKTWDYLSIIFLIILDAGLLACVLTININQVLILAIKIGAVFVGFILNFVIYLCCLNGSSTHLREKIQEILDSKDEYFDSKGMRWTVCSDFEFPYWIELHIQSQFEMKLKQENEELQAKKKETGKNSNYSENKGILENQPGKKVGGAINKKPNKKGFVNLEEFNEEDEDEDYEDQAHVEAEVEIEDELAQVEDEQEEQQVRPNPYNQPRQQIHLDARKKKNVDRLYAPLDEDYEENYDEEAAM